MKVTTKAWDGNGKTHPPLWDVLIDGRKVGMRYSFSALRVLKAGKRYIPISDLFDVYPGTFATRREAALFLARKYKEGT